MSHVVPALIILVGCATNAELSELRAEVQKQRAETAALQETVALQGERLDAQSAILARLDDARIEAVKAAVEPAAAPEWLEVRDDRIIIQRATMPEPDALMRLGRVLPHRDPAGDPDGYRLAGIRRGTALDLMGLRNGDVVHRIAGVDVTSLEALMEAWQRMGDGGSFEVELSRRGSRETLVLDFQ